ncbi:MAG: substrate-binding domain-containing protein [Opitutaceae bacterium]|jgi:DNA-binding LacI/PurR family transcriptional regulator
MSDTEAQFLYQHAITEILVHIQANNLKPGCRMPSEREFAAIFSCGRPTVNKAIACLIAEGRLRREGYKLYVASPPFGEASKTLIAVLCPHPLHHQQQISHNLVEAAHDVCQAAKVRFNPILSFDGEQQRAQLAELINQDIDGIAIWPHTNGSHADLFRQFALRKLPIVVNDFYSKYYDFVGVDNSKGIQSILSHLHELGHREVAYLTRRASNENLNERLEAYRYGTHTTFPGKSSGRVYELPGELTAGLPELFKNLLKNSPEVTAICCSNDVIALELIALCQKLKIRIPRELSIAGFDGIDVREGGAPTLTTVAQDFYQMGALAIDLLVRRIRLRVLKHTSVLQQIRVAPHLIVRASTGTALLKEPLKNDPLLPCDEHDGFLSGRETEKPAGNRHFSSGLG